MSPPYAKPLGFHVTPDCKGETALKTVMIEGGISHIEAMYLQDAVKDGLEIKIENGVAQWTWDYTEVGDRQSLKKAFGR